MNMNLTIRILHTSPADEGKNMPINLLNTLYDIADTNMANTKYIIPWKDM